MNQKPLCPVCMNFAHIYFAPLSLRLLSSLCPSVCVRVMSTSSLHVFIQFCPLWSLSPSVCVHSYFPLQAMSVQNQSLRLLSPDVVTVSYLRNLQDQILSSHHPPSQETVSLVRCLLLSLQAHKVDLEGVLYCIALYSRALCSKSRSKLSDIN